MSFIEVNQLRKSGRLQEAFEMAQTDLKQEQSEWTYSAMFWVMRDYCNLYIANEQKDHAEKCLEKMKPLLESMDDFDGFANRSYNALRRQLTPNWELVSEMSELSKSGNVVDAFNRLSELHKNTSIAPPLHEDFGWIIYRYLQNKYKEIGSVSVRKALHTYINLENERPSLLHSQILNFALNYSKSDENFKFVSFLKLWGPQNLRSHDFDDSCSSDGKTIPSLMSRIARVMVNYPQNEVQDFVELLPLNKEIFIEMMKEHFFWKLYHNTEGGITSSTWELFNQYLDLFPEAPASSAHSKVLGLAERIMKDNNAFRFYDFFKRWNPEKLRSDDWKEENGNNGETYKPLAVKSLKKAKEAVDCLSREQTGDLLWLVDLYGKAVEKFPDDDWIIRSKALLLIKIGQLANAKNIYRDLCLKMSEKYYIWQEFSYCYEEDKPKIALLCKALSLEKNEDFIGKIRLVLARLLIRNHRYENALVEITQYRKHYKEKGWHIELDVDNLQNQCSSAIPAPDNNESFYAENIRLAEDLAYEDIPFTEVVLADTWKNDDGKVLLTFVDGDSIEFTINKKRFQVLNKSYKGQVWKMKLYKEETINIVPSDHSWCPPKKETVIKYKPLIITPSETPDWQILPVKYGYVNHINTEKKVYHIYSTDSKPVYEHYEHQLLQKGDFVSFRQYKKNVRGEEKEFFVSIQKCEGNEAIEHFKCRIVAVDDVNEHHQLFHFVLGPKLISGLLHFDQTELRPAVGDFIQIYYYVRIIEDKKNPGLQKKVIEVVKAEATDEINGDLVKIITGILEMKYRNHYDSEEPDFAFIGDYYVHKSILKKYHIDSDCRVKAKVIYSGDGKWKVFEIMERE